MSKILVCKNERCIVISQDGKRFIIDKDDELFNQLKDLSKDEIVEWYSSR